MKKSNKIIGSFLGVIGATVIIALGVTTLKTNLVDALTIPNTTYYLTLDSSNKVTSHLFSITNLSPPATCFEGKSASLHNKQYA